MLSFGAINPLFVKIKHYCTSQEEIFPDLKCSFSPYAVLRNKKRVGIRRLIREGFGEKYIFPEILAFLVILLKNGRDTGVRHNGKTAIKWFYRP